MARNKESKNFYFKSFYFFIFFMSRLLKKSNIKWRVSVFNNQMDGLTWIEVIYYGDEWNCLKRKRQRIIYARNSFPKQSDHSAGNLELHSSPVSSSYSSRGSVSPQGTHSASTGSSPTFSKKIHQMIIIDHEEVLWTIFLHLLNQLL